MSKNEENCPENDKKVGCKRTSMTGSSFSVFSFHSAAIAGLPAQKETKKGVRNGWETAEEEEIWI